MQPLRLTIEGSYYDSQIYSGRLYLWHMDGSISIINWDELIDAIKVPEQLKLSLRCGFLQSQYLYGDQFKPLFHDIEVREVITRKFETLSQIDLVVSAEQIEQHTVRRQNNPGLFPHADSLIYRNTLFSAGQGGVAFSGINARNKSPISLRSDKVWDAPVLDMSASYGALALAAGSEGVFQYDLDDHSFFTNDREKLAQPLGLTWHSADIFQDTAPAQTVIRRRPDPTPIIREHSNSVRWLYASVFSTSYYNQGYLADFSISSSKETPDANERSLDAVRPSTSLYSNKIGAEQVKLSWGLHDKICLVTDDQIRVSRYNFYEKSTNQYDGKSRFSDLGEIEIPGLDTAEIISADSALFGYIIETERGLIVMDSNLQLHWFEGEPVNWRVFSKSKFYENQLHIVQEDRLIILSFNQDYFVDQAEKTVGIRLSRSGNFNRQYRASR